MNCLFQFWIPQKCVEESWAMSKHGGDARQQGARAEGDRKGGNGERQHNRERW